MSAVSERRHSLSGEPRAFLLGARRAVLATTRADGRPRLVPICFALDGDTLLSVIDEKPKATRDPRQLGRIRDIVARPEVSILIDRWDEDWTRLAWLRLDGRARLVEPGDPSHARALALLRDRYAPYRSMDLERSPVIAVEPRAVVTWGDLRP